MKRLKPLYWSLFISAIYFLLTTGHFYLDRYFHGWLYFLLFSLTIGITLFLLYKSATGVYWLFNGKPSLIKDLSTIVYLAFLLIGLFNPFDYSFPLPKIDSTLRGCSFKVNGKYAKIHLRENNTFDIHETGSYYSRWYDGEWKKTGDTILLSYNREQAQFSTKYSYREPHRWRVISEKNELTDEWHFYPCQCQGTGNKKTRPIWYRPGKM